jgi:signal transduction histidine kinase
LQQIIWNLISNAIKFTPKDGRVEIRLAQVDSHLEVSVKDDGIGINEQFLPLLSRTQAQRRELISASHVRSSCVIILRHHLASAQGHPV